jgi:hypothetical protein
MEHNKAPGMDGLLAEFYQVFWKVIKGTICPILKSFTRVPYPFLVSILVQLRCYTKTETGDTNPTIPAHLSTQCQFQNFHQGVE